MTTEQKAEEVRKELFKFLIKVDDLDLNFMVNRMSGNLAFLDRKNDRIFELMIPEDE